MQRLLDKVKSVSVGHRVDRLYAMYENGKIGNSEYVKMIGYLMDGK